MSLPPEFFRHMTPGQIAFALAIDEGLERTRTAKVSGATCSVCMDTGLAPSGVTCGCERGFKLGLQAFKPIAVRPDADTTERSDLAREEPNV